MFPLAPLSLIGRMVAGELVGGLASAAFGATRQASNPPPSGSFSDLLDKTDLHGNGWLSESAATRRGIMADGRDLSAPQPAETERACSAAGPAAGTPPAQMLLAAQAGPPGTVIAAGPDMPMVARIHETYAALRAQCYG